MPMTTEQVNEAYVRYLTHKEPVKDIALSYGISPSNLHRYFGKSNLKVRNHSTAQRKYILNHNAFSTITPESAYWIGFLMADGCVYKRPQRSATISCILSVKDKTHLTKLACFLGTDTPIRYTKAGGYAKTSEGNASLQVLSNQMAKDLEVYGIIPRKTGLEKAPNKLMGDRDFWRGVVDGDGGVYCYNGRWSLYLYGNKQICGEFLDYTKTVTKTKASVSPHYSIFKVALKDTPAKDLVKTLYEDAETSLDRKMEMASRCIYPQLPL